MANIKQNGGYNALPISYKRGNPIPLDQSSVWYDYDLMADYAQNNPTAYVGQVLSLVDVNNETKAKLYIITDLNGTLTLIGSVDDVYTKAETDTLIESAVVNAAHLKRVTRNSKEEINPYEENALERIYMVPTLSDFENEYNKYDEYIVIETDVIDPDDSTRKLRIVEYVGSWDVDLSEYATKEELKNYIKNPTDGSRLISQQEITRLADTYTKTEGITTNDISDLDQWGSSLIQNIGVSNLSDALKNQINNAILKTQVNTSQFSIDDSGILSIKPEILNSNSTGVSVIDFEATVGNLETMLEEKFNVYDEIKNINDALTWQYIKTTTEGE